VLLSMLKHGLSNDLMGYNSAFRAAMLLMFGILFMGNLPYLDSLSDSSGSSLRATEKLITRVVIKTNAIDSENNVVEMDAGHSRAINAGCICRVFKSRENA
jgi:hypothetical protein